ncbi:hypothetical protein L950_0221695 [Sphingobacterium sp. IITKGP-BTPF85]|nr:hypothetical protein L950_0221695 [Sphingobacterium sp. IITKGP-BTPF85]
MSKSFLPCAKAISTFANPLALMKIRKGTIVNPFSSPFTRNFFNSFFVKSNWRSRFAS